MILFRNSFANFVRMMGIFFIKIIYNLMFPTYQIRCVMSRLTPICMCFLVLGRKLRRALVSIGSELVVWNCTYCCSFSVFGKLTHGKPHLWIGIVTKLKSHILNSWKFSEIFFAIFTRLCRVFYWHIYCFV